ncbi:MAG: hypothetical protein IJT23_04700 [Clostridia bacterium]|nr:hypothetical protein [Clostridia bacterium]
MGLGDFFKKSFGKQECALCGSECGVMHRTKLKDGNFACNICVRECSKYVRLSELTTDEVKGHIEYMRRQEKLYQKCFKDAKRDTYPSAFNKQAISFADDLGMFEIMDRDTSKNKVNHELFRYDQVLGYEAYVEKEKPMEAGKPEEFKESGVKIRLVGVLDHIEHDPVKAKMGLKAHPYIKREIKVTFHTKESDVDYTANAVAHFNRIFGVNDDQKGLFSFGMSTKEKRDLMGAVAGVKTAMDAVKAAKDGEISEEKAKEVEKNLNAMSDAATGGLAVYTRRADEAEAQID